MDILSIARQHFNEKRSKYLGKVEVPEWKDEAGNHVVIYVRPLNMKEAAERQQYAMDRDYSNFNIATLIHAACDQDMKPMFPNASKTQRDIMATQLCTNVLNRIVNEISDLLDERAMSEDLSIEKKS